MLNSERQLKGLQVGGNNGEQEMILPTSCFKKNIKIKITPWVIFFCKMEKDFKQDVRQERKMNVKQYGKEEKPHSFVQ